MNNDNRILELKEQINIKRKKLKAIKKFSPITNCIIELNGSKININVLKKDELILLTCKLHSYKKSADELGYELIISSFNVDEWLSDLRGKIDFLSKKDEEVKLKNMENKLNSLLSNDKKIELELDEIENFIK